MGLLDEKYFSVAIFFIIIYKLKGLVAKIAIDRVSKQFVDDTVRIIYKRCFMVILLLEPTKL